jgi:Amt family ammonium transporter
LSLWLLLILCLLWPSAAQAQASAAPAQATLAVPLFWYVLATALAFLVPIGLVLIGVAGLDGQHAWNAALGAVAAVGLALFGYWAVGFALHFGGIGLVYPLRELRHLVWEWSPLAAEWGIGWGAAGLSGWFLAAGDVTPLTYALFLAHLPWVVTAAILPMTALRGRAPATATLFLALVMGALVYPLAGNWVQGGGWLSGLGRNLNLGHGFVDFGAAGTIFLVAAGFALAALVVWAPRRLAQPLEVLPLPPAYQPLLAVVGSLLVLAGALGWLWANPLQVGMLGDLALLRGSVNVVLFASGGLLIPLAYTWFVTGRSDPLMTARGLQAGLVAGLAIGPFVQPGVAFLIGLLAGATVPFVTFVVDGLLRLDDTTGVVTANAVPAMVGLVMVGIFADGATGAGWQMTGVESYLGVDGQGVSGLLVPRGYQIDFPGQLQAQLIGLFALSLWGFLTGMVVCTPVALLLHGLKRSEQPQHDEQPAISNDGFEIDQLDGEFLPLATRERQERV